MDKNYKVYIAGHLGMVGSAIRRRMVQAGYSRFIERSIDEMDLTNQQETAAFFQAEKPDIVINAAAIHF